MSRPNAAFSLPLDRDLPPAEASPPLAPSDFSVGVDLELRRLGAMLIAACRAFETLATAQGVIARRHAAHALCTVLDGDPKAKAKHIARAIDSLPKAGGDNAD